MRARRPWATLEGQPAWAPRVSRRMSSDDRTVYFIPSSVSCPVYLMEKHPLGLRPASLPGPLQPSL